MKRRAENEPATSREVAGHDEYLSKSGILHSEVRT